MGKGQVLKKIGLDPDVLQRRLIKMLTDWLAKEQTKFRTQWKTKKF